MSYILTSETAHYWRTYPTSVDFYAFLHQPEVVFKARANAPIATYPLYLLLYDTVTYGDYTDLEEDMVMLIGTSEGADDLGRVRLRKYINGNVATSDTIYIQRSSQGILDGEIDLQDNAYLTVLRFFPITAVPPVITPSGMILKDSEVVFDVDTHLLPVANAGMDTLVVLPNIGDTVELTFGEWSSFATRSGATIASYSWVMPDGQTSTSATPTFTFEADTVGYYKLTVTDSNGQSTTGRRFLAVVNRNHPNILRDWEISGNHTAGLNGQTMNVRIRDVIPRSTYPDGVEFLVAMRERHGGSAGAHEGGLVGASGRENMVIAGFLGPETHDVSFSQRGITDQSTFEIWDTSARAKQLPSFTQLIERESTPTHWGQMEGANVDRYIWNILYWHSNILRRVDFRWSGTGDDYAFQVLGSDGGNLFDQANQRCRAIAHELVVDRYGRWQMLPDPQLQQEADRSSEIIVAISQTDWQTLRRTYNPHPRHHWQRGEALIASAVNASSGQEIQAVLSIAPGKAPGAGVGMFVAGEELVISQTEKNQRDGARYRARTNALENTYEITLRNIGYIIDPALFKYIRFEVQAEASGVRRRAVDPSTRFLPIEVRYTYDHEKGIRNATIVMEREGTHLIDAVTEPVPDDPGFELPDHPQYPTVPPIDPPATAFGIPDYDGTDIVPTKGIVFDAAGAHCSIFTGFNPTASSLVYTDRSTGLTGSVIWATGDAFNWNRYYALTTTGLYKNDDPFGGLSWSLVMNNAALYGDAARIGRQIITSINRNGYFAIRSGNMYVYTTDSFATVNRVSITGGADSYQTSLTADYGTIDISKFNNPEGAGWVYAAVNATGALSDIYKSENWGATWSLIEEDVPILGPSGSLDVPYKRPGGIADNENDASQVVYIQGGGFGNNGRLLISESAGVTWTEKYVPLGADAFFPYGTIAGSNLHTFTYDSDIVIHGTSQNLGSSRIRRAVDEGATTTFNGLGYGFTGSTIYCNGYPVHSKAIIAWNSAAGGTVIRWTVDGGATSGQANKPGNFSGGVAYVEWNIADLF
jgi:hypothetical protein